MASRNHTQLPTTRKGMGRPNASIDRYTIYCDLGQQKRKENGLNICPKLYIYMTPHPWNYGAPEETTVSPDDWLEERQNRLKVAWDKAGESFRLRSEKQKLKSQKGENIEPLRIGRSLLT